MFWFSLENILQRDTIVLHQVPPWFTDAYNQNNYFTTKRSGYTAGRKTKAWKEKQMIGIKLLTVKESRWNNVAYS